MGTHKNLNVVFKRFQEMKRADSNSLSIGTYTLIISLIVLSSFSGAIFVSRISQAFSRKPAISESDFREVSKPFEDDSEDESYSHVQIIPENVKNCLQVPSECPQFASGQLEGDYPFRFSRRQNTGCYFEFQDFSTSCFDACEYLFFTSSKHARFGFKVSQACKVGCNYAKYAKSAKKDTCMYTCKNTAWKQQINDQSCNWKKGLNLEIDEVPDFEISKACEFGCILGNERPCPACENPSHTKNVFFDV